MFGSFLFDVKRFTNLAFEVRLEPLPDDLKFIQPDSMVIFVVGVNQEVGVLVLLVVLYHALEESAFRLANVDGVALWVRSGHGRRRCVGVLLSSDIRIWN